MRLFSNVKFIASAIFFILCAAIVMAQPISGIWRGKMGSAKIELKLVRKGDSLIGTSYYYDSRSGFRRYSVKGYFDDRNNDVIWWDDVLIEAGGHAPPGQLPLLASADFNCPGEGIMKLDGKTSRKEDEQKERKELHLVKVNAEPIFPDEWDFLINHYVYCLSHPELMDSIEQLAFHPSPVEQAPTGIPEGNQTSLSASPAKPLGNNSITEHTTSGNHEAVVPAFLPPALQTNEERFTSRKKILQQVIPVKGDSIEIRFYDNAEIDGDSIAVFLNGRILQEHILLAEQAYIIKIALTDLKSDNELVMVAENLGSIPPNTSLMVAIVDDRRYEAHLQSTEGSSAMVRLIK